MAVIKRMKIIFKNMIRETYLISLSGEVNWYFGYEGIPVNYLRICLVLDELGAEDKVWYPPRLVRRLMWAPIGWAPLVISVIDGKVGDLRPPTFLEKLAYSAGLIILRVSPKYILGRERRERAKRRLFQASLRKIKEEERQQSYSQRPATLEALVDEF